MRIKPKLLFDWAIEPPECEDEVFIKETVFTEYSHPQCIQGINTVCTVCPSMKVTPTIRNGASCTQSRCKLGFWTGGLSWNRLYFGKEISDGDCRREN